MKGKRVKYLRKLKQKAMRYADKAERVGWKRTSRFYAIAEHAFDLLHKEGVKI